MVNVDYTKSVRENFTNATAQENNTFLIEITPIISVES